MSNMIWVTGDTHGDWVHRLNMDSFPEQREMAKDDYVIVLGDFGIWKDTNEQRYNLNWLDERNFTTLFVDGNHSNFDLLNSYPVSEWHGGKVHFINDSVIHLMRGQIFNIDDKSFFTFGGARSHDIHDGILEADDPRIQRWRKDMSKMYRINHISWWKEEMPNEEEMDEGLNNLSVVDILTHCTASSTQALMSGGRFKPDKLTDYLERVRYTTEYTRWLFGHYHTNMAVNDKDICLFEQIVRVA